MKAHKKIAATMMAVAMMASMSTGIMMKRGREKAYIVGNW